MNFSYDGRLLTNTSWSGIVTPAPSVHRDYDGHLRLGCECLNGGCQLSNGVCVASGSPAGLYPVTFTYDADGLLTGAGLLSITRDATNALLTNTSIGTISDNLQYNSFGEVEHYTARKGDPITGDVVLQLDYGRDNLGRIATKAESIWNGTANDAYTYAYGYDDAGRLEDVHQGGTHTAHYIYDANGNRLQRSNPSVPGSEVNGQYDGQDRLNAYGTTTYEYTANGELKKKTTAAGDTTYTYDALGDLRSVTLPSGQAISYTVDGQNHRIWKTVDGTRVKGFLYGGALQVVAELDGAGNVVSRFVYGSRANVPDTMVTSSGTYRILSDQLGSPRLIVNATSGAFVGRIDYDEFGNVLEGSNVDLVPFGFAGGLYDADTRLVRFGARDYSADIGRWVNKDPIAFGGWDTNLYVYVGNDPINFIDPFGLMKLPPNPNFLPPEWQLDPRHLDPFGDRYLHPNGDVLDFHRGRPGLPGNRGKDHWHYNGGKDYLEPGTEIPDGPEICEEPNASTDPGDDGGDPSSDPSG